MSKPNIPVESVQNVNIHSKTKQYNQLAKIVDQNEYYTLQLDDSGLDETLICTQCFRILKEARSVIIAGTK